MNTLKICLRLVQPTAHRLPTTYHNIVQTQGEGQVAPLSESATVVLYLAARSLQDSQIERTIQRHDLFLF